jgi:hypothetical protein
MKGWFTTDLIQVTDPTTHRAQAMPDFKGVTGAISWCISAASATECLLLVVAVQSIQTSLATAGLKSWGTDSNDPTFIATLTSEANRLGAINWNKGGVNIPDPNPNS